MGANKPRLQAASGAA